MKLPPQGFRHAVELLLAGRVRAFDDDGAAIAADLLALASDMHAPREYADWTAAEFERRLHTKAPPLLRDRWPAHAAAEPRDVFLVYVPEDRLPVAAVLAVELTKRGTTVAFSDFEVATQDELATAIARGITTHRTGGVVVSDNFHRRGLQLPPGHALRIADARTPPAVLAAEWVAHIQSTNDGAIQAHD